MIPLMCAACEGHLEVVCELLSLGVDCTERTCHNFAGVSILGPPFSAAVFQLNTCHRIELDKLHCYLYDVPQKHS